MNLGRNCCLKSWFHTENWVLDDYPKQDSCCILVFAHICFYMFMVTESWLEYWVQSKWFFGNQLLHIYINVTLNYIFNMMLHLLISIFIHVWLMQRKKVIYYDTQERRKKRNLCQFWQMWWQTISYMNCLIARNTFHICHSLHRTKCYLMVAATGKTCLFVPIHLQPILLRVSQM